MTSNTVAEYTFVSSASTNTSETVAFTNNTSETLSIQYYLAAYDVDGRMVTCEVATADLSNRESISLTVTYTVSDEVVLIKAFVVETGTFVPVCSAWEKAFDS